MLADIQRTVYPEEVTRQLIVMVQGRESLLVIERHSDQLCYAVETQLTREDCIEETGNVINLLETAEARKNTKPQVFRVCLLNDN